MMTILKRKSGKWSDSMYLEGIDVWGRQGKWPRKSKIPNKTKETQNHHLGSNDLEG
jgi:hypothetical protein